VGVAVGAICAPIVETGQLLESWQHRLTRTSAATLGGGAAAARMRLKPGDPYVDRVYPVLRGTFEHARVVENVRTSVRVDALVAPAIDVRTGTLDQRGQASISLTVPMRRVTFSGSFAGARSIASPAVRPLKSLTGVFETTYRMTRVTSLGAGVRYAWQEQDGLATIAGGAAFMQVTFTVPEAHF
jgi:hypothetical protein